MSPLEAPRVTVARSNLRVALQGVSIMETHSFAEHGLKGAAAEMRTLVMQVAPLRVRTDRSAAERITSNQWKSGKRDDEGDCGPPESAQPGPLKFRVTLQGAAHGLR